MEELALGHYASKRHWTRGIDASAAAREGVGQLAVRHRVVDKLNCFEGIPVRFGVSICPWPKGVEMGLQY